MCVSTTSPTTVATTITASVNYGDVTSTPTRAAISRVFAHSKPDLAWSAKHRVPKVVGRKTAAVTRDE
jgi:hypothetical protein